MILWLLKKFCVKTTVIIKDNIFDLYPEYKESYFNNKEEQA